MRVIIIPDTPLFWIAVAGLLVLVIVIAIYQTIRPPRLKRLLADDRYHQALSVYAGNLPGEDPTRDERRQALAVAADYLTNEHGLDAEEARANMRLVVAEYDREQSYDLRYEASAYEQAGAHDLALTYYERAARLQQEHDPKDYLFLQQCIDRVRRKVRSG